MALNWGKGAEAVSEGLIRQADIGGLMYKQAASVESARKAGELKQQERLWDVQVQIAKEADADYQTILEAIVEAEGANLEITPKLQQRFEDAEIRREQAYAPLGVLSPGGGGRMEHTFVAAVKGLLDVATVEDAKDWRITFGEGKTPPPVNTMFKRILEERGLTGDKNAEQQLQEQFLSALQQPIKAEATAGALGADIEGTGLMSQASQGSQGTRRSMTTVQGGGTSPWQGIKDVGSVVKAGVMYNAVTGDPVEGAVGRSRQLEQNRTVAEEAVELENTAMQRQISQMSQQGQQYWQKYMEAKLREKRTDAIATLREEYNALSDADRQIVLQLHAAGN
tara:strand:+ start:664 stop:1677 length:1014 start_codon:yes stop_codon:yes gene_type:complete